MLGLRMCLAMCVANYAGSISSAFGQAKQLPNILLIVADDMGYSDAGCYGGEIDTPSIDRIANEGIRFSNFYVNPMCVVTRTSLLTGHEHSQSKNYTRSIPLPLMLKRAGYHTSISGKWHQPANPLDWGFDSFYGFLNGEINGWRGTYTDGKTLAIQHDRNKPTPVAEDWYCSDAFTDHAIEQIDAAADSGKPFFAYVPFNAPHGPLHAPKANVEKYYGRFDQGWDELRRQRMKRMQDSGVIDDRFVSNQPEAEVAVWDELPKSVRDLESKRFCAYAGMVDRMDENIGRLLNHLESTQLLDNTLIVFLSDNGGNYSHGSIDSFDKEVPWRATGPRPACATGWARLMNTPFSWYKTSAFRGGVSAPLIVRWPKINAAFKEAKRGSILHQRIHVSDLYPTLLEVVGQTYPGINEFPNRKPLYGKSMLPLFSDPGLPELAIRNEIFWGFNETSKGLLSDYWKLSSINDSPWRLYDLRKDPTETTDLAAEFPDELASLSERWFAFAQNEAEMDPSWRRSLNKTWQGWGLHRIKMAMPLTSISPAVSAIQVDTDTSLKMEFAGPISFADTGGCTISLYSTRDPQTPVWQFDPDEKHPAEGKREIEFDLPTLAPATTYFMLTSPNWIKIGGKPAGRINDGAYFYRFRTRD